MEQQLDSWAVVIVGCGPVGMTLANLLGSYGVSTLVLEKNPELFNRPRAVGTDCECMRTWQAIGLADEMLADMIPLGPDGLGMLYLDARGRPFAEVRPDTTDNGFALGYGIIQPLVDRILLGGLTRFEHVEVRFSHRVEGVVQSGTYACVFGKTGTGRRFAGRADYVVACDGGHSTVRGGLKIPMRGFTNTERWLVLDTLETNRPGGPPRNVEIRCDPRRPSVSVPRLHGHRRWEFLLRGDLRDETLLEPDRITSMLGRYVDPRRVEVIRKGVFRFSGRVAARWREGRVLLAGDAAHVTPPFAAQGVADGVRDAFNLGWKLARVVAGNAPQKLLDTYTLERHAQARANIRFAHRLGRIMMPRNRIQATIVQTAFRLLGHSAAIRDFIRQAGPKPATRIADGFVWRDAGAGRLTGLALPQPRLVDAGGQCRRLDDVLGLDFGILGIETDPTRRLPGPVGDRWSGIGTRFVTVLPPERPPRRPGEWRATSHDLSRWLGKRADRILLVRPDRFVAADLPAENAADPLTALADRLLPRPSGRRLRPDLASLDRRL